MPIIIFYLWQGVAVGQNAECSKLKNGKFVMHNGFTNNKCQPNTKINDTV